MCGTASQRDWAARLFDRRRAVRLALVTTKEALTDNPPGFRGVYRRDGLARSLYAEGAGIARIMPQAVAVPADADDVAPLVRWAKRNGHSLVPRGSGSGMAAGAVGDGVVVDLSRFKAIGEVDTESRCVRVGTGALRGEIDEAARAHGLQFPVDPSSGAFCTIGGMIAANAAGARTLRYGATRAWIRGLHCVFDDGTMAWIRRNEPPPTQIPAVARLMQSLAQLARFADRASLHHAEVRKESSGYAAARAMAPDGHLLDLLVGSEGTLAIFVAAEVALAPLPVATATVLASFASLEAASECAQQIREDGASACELLDRTFLEIAARGRTTGVPSLADAVLLIEVEGEDAKEAASGASRMAERCRAHGATTVTEAVTPDAEHELWELRHAASPILAQLAPRLRSMQFIEDGCVPATHFPSYVRGVRAALSKYATTGVIFGHAGDAHAHVNPLLDTAQSDWRERVYGLMNDVTELVARLGGTVSGEHGDGRLRTKLLPRVWSAEAMAAFANIKAAADPAGVFNFGCKVAATTESSHATVWRHDPDAPPIDARARAILVEFARPRWWSTSRWYTNTPAR